jgi:xanthine dehydrogenase YagR molybdenum-binding subunit
MVCVQNCGLPINRLTLRSQIFGGMVQALSYALLEERIMEPSLGLQINPNFEDYKLAGSLEIGEIVAIIDDEDTREQAIGVSEATIVPGHSAIANAVANACGARVRHLPLTPDKVLAALGKV